MQTSDKIRVGVIGAGKMGELHVKKYLEIPQIEFVGIFDPSPERAKLLSEKYGIVAHPHLAELLFEVDAASVASPTETHYTIAKQCFESGVHVLLEKPIAHTAEEGEELVTLAASQGLVFQVGFLERFRYQTLTRNVPFSPIRFIESDRLSISLSREATIDVVSDLMIHDLDLALSLIGEDPILVSAVGLPVVTPLIDLANARLEFPGGAIVNLNASRVSERPTRKFRVFSQDFYASVDLIQNRAELFKRGPNAAIHRTAFEEDKLDALRLQCEDFVRCVREKGKPLVSGSDGVRALRIAKRIRDDISERNIKYPSSYQKDLNRSLGELRENTAEH